MAKQKGKRKGEREGIFICFLLALSFPGVDVDVVPLACGLPSGAAPAAPTFTLSRLSPAKISRRSADARAEAFRRRFGRAF